MPVMSSPTAAVETSSSTGSIQKVYPQSGSVRMEATHFHISPLAKFAPKTYDGDHWIKCSELFAAATEWDGLSDKVRIDMLIYILGKNAVDIYDSFTLSGEDIQYASVKQKFKDDSLIQVYCHQFLKCGDIFLECLKFPTKKMRVKCVKPPERQIQKSMRKQDRGNSLRQGKLAGLVLCYLD